MIDRRDHEAVVGKRLGRIAIAEQRTAAPMRGDNERQMPAHEGAVLHPRQREAAADGDLGRLFRAWIPDHAMDLRTVGRRGNVDRSQTGGVRQRGSETDGEDREDLAGADNSEHRGPPWLMHLGR